MILAQTMGTGHMVLVSKSILFVCVDAHLNNATSRTRDSGGSNSNCSSSFQLQRSAL